MKYSAAYLLAILGGNPSPDVAAIAKILGGVGIECDEGHARRVVDACRGRDINEIIASGMTKVNDALASTFSGATSGPSPNITIPPVVRPPTPIQDSPPGSPGGDDSFVSTCFQANVVILINMFLFISIGRLIRLT